MTHLNGIGGHCRHPSGIWMRGAHGMRNEIAARKRSYVNRLRERIVISKATIVRCMRLMMICRHPLVWRSVHTEGEKEVDTIFLIETTKKEASAVKECSHP